MALPDQIIGTIHITRLLNDKGDIQTNWELTEGMTYEEAITALEMTKLKIHHHMMKEHSQ